MRIFSSGGDCDRPDGESEIKRLQRQAYAATVGRWDLQMVGRERSQEAWHSFGHGDNGVIAGLCELLDRHLARGRGRLQPAVIGCVPWFDHIGIAERLAMMPSCIVINKPKSRTSAAVRDLYERGQTFHSEWLLDLHDLAPMRRDGTPRVVGPGERMGSSLGPVRVYGYREDKGHPLLHTKMLVLGGACEDDDTFSGIHFLPDVVWIGSANWTSKADTLNVEAAVAVADRSFVEAATRHVASIISRSEPISRYSATPVPNLASSQLDMAAFADHAAEFSPAMRNDEIARSATTATATTHRRHHSALYSRLKFPKMATVTDLYSRRVVGRTVINMSILARSTR